MARPHAWLVLLTLVGGLAAETTDTETAETLAQMPEDPQTLSQMLQWSLDHTDLDVLHQKAEAIRASSAAGGQASTEPASDALPAPALKSADEDPDMMARLRELSDLTAALMPDQVAMMREALELAGNETAEEEDRETGLLNLQQLVSDIDNARDLKAINEYPTVLTFLMSERPVLQTAAAWVLGSAAQNHRELQLHLLELGALSSLLRLMHSHESVELRAKALCVVTETLSCPAALVHATPRVNASSQPPPQVRHVRAAAQLPRGAGAVHARRRRGRPCGGTRRDASAQVGPEGARSADGLTRRAAE